jgi:3-dehydroquinate synthase
LERFRISSRHFQYSAVYGRGAWRALRQLEKGNYSSAFIVTERPLWARWGREFLAQSLLKVRQVLHVPQGENSKSLAMAGKVAAQLSKCGADRKSLLITFGGGVIGDLGGFVASTYMRGIDLVHIPTTVLAQVDSALGGKTAVNVGGMKNLVGTFYSPRLVVADPIVLTSLSDRAFRSGLYEVVKHAILAGSQLFHLIDHGMANLRAKKAARLSPILAEAARVKIRVVNRDEREAQLRMVLNLGHTYGHAIEEATRYQRYMHGEAVGWGLLAVIRLGELLAITRRADAELMCGLVKRVGPLPSIRDLDPNKTLRLLAKDKKAVGGRVIWIIPERVGNVRIVHDVPASLVAEAFRDTQKLLWHA